MMVCFHFDVLLFFSPGHQVPFGRGIGGVEQNDCGLRSKSL